MQEDAFVTCLRCGNRNSYLVSHCYYCGDRLERICGHCGHSNPPEVEYYCENCGQSLVGSQKEAAIGSPESDQDNAQPVNDVVKETKSQPSETAPGLDAGFCPRCKNPYQPGSSYCSICGLALKDKTARGTTLTAGAFDQGVPAGFWIRELAYFIDWGVLFIWGVFSYLLYSGDFVVWRGVEAELTLFDLLNLVIGQMYAPVLIGLWSTTVGKRAFGAYVVKIDGGRCGFWRALGREFAKVLSFLILGIGFLMIAFREDKRGLHDLIAGTAVIRRNE